MNAEQLTATVSEMVREESPVDATWAWDRLASRPPRPMGEAEYTSRLWGYVFGLAYATARARNPKAKAEFSEETEAAILAAVEEAEADAKGGA